MQDRGRVVHDLKALAMDFEGLALDESNPKRYKELRDAAGQVRSAWQAVAEGFYDSSTGAAWLAAGQLTVRRLEKVKSR